MATINYHRECRVCGNNHMLDIIHLGEHHLHGSFVYPDFHPPTRRTPVLLARCDPVWGGCGTVQLRHSIDPDILYARYGYRSATNETMRKHLANIAHTSINKLRGAPKSEPIMPKCLDIGCNDGYLLRQYPPPCPKVGIDPCDVGNTIKDIENFKFINSLYPNDTLTEQFNIITMIACFYDINDPINVACRLHNNLAPYGILVVEVSYWPAKMEQSALDEVCQEHVCFYNYQNLEYIFNAAGLKIFDAKLNDINGGSIQLWMCHNDINAYDTQEGKSNILKIKFNEFDQKLDLPTPYHEFNRRCYELQYKMKEVFDQIKQRKETVHLYGASTKGNVLLQFFGLTATDIPYAAERSPAKWGGHTLGTNIMMISEEESRKMNPDYYFVPIWSFKKEIMKREEEYLKRGGKLIFPLPQLEIIENGTITTGPIRSNATGN